MTDQRTRIIAARIATRKLGSGPSRSMIYKAVNRLEELINDANIPLKVLHKAEHIEDIRAIRKKTWKDILWDSGMKWFYDVDDYGDQTEESKIKEQEFEYTIMDEMAKIGIIGRKVK